LCDTHISSVELENLTYMKNFLSYSFIFSPNFFFHETKINQLTFRRKKNGDRIIVEENTHIMEKKEIGQIQYRIDQM